MTECFLYLLLCNTIHEPTLHKLYKALYNVFLFLPAGETWVQSRSQSHARDCDVISRQPALPPEPWLCLLAIIPNHYSIRMN